MGASEDPGSSESLPRLRRQEAVLPILRQFGNLSSREAPRNVLQMNFLVNGASITLRFESIGEYVSVTVIGRRMSSSLWVRLAQERADGLWTTIRQRTGSRDQYGGTTTNVTST